MQSERTSAAEAPSYTERARKVAQVLGRDFTPRGMDRFGWTDLHYAVVIGDSALVRRLLQDGADANAHLRDGCFPSQRLIEALVGEGAGAEHWRWLTDTPLRLATRRDDTAMADLLIAHGADVNEAGEGSHPPLIDAARYDACNVAALLIGSGARIGCRIHDDRTPLHWAAACNAVENAHQVVSLLLDRGAPVNVRNRYYDMPLHRAAKRHALAAAEVLIERGADVDAPATAVDRLTPLHFAGWAGPPFDLLELLLRHGADVDAPEIDDSDTLLHYAAARDDWRLAELLVAHGASVDEMNEIRWTPLHRAADQDAWEVADVLLRHGADVHIETNDGTALHIAAAVDGSRVAGLLLARGAEATRRNRFGETPLNVAIRENADAVIVLLRLHESMDG